MRSRHVTVLIGFASVFGAAATLQGVSKPGPQKSGFYDFWDITTEFSPGLGTEAATTCTIDAASQPAVYAGNFRVDCDGEVPHNETTIVTNPTNPNHVVGGYHSYHISNTGGTAHVRVLSSASVSFDAGQSWRQVTPPPEPYQFTGDPALSFDSRGRLYLASIADHEGQGGNFTGPSVVVAHSDDGGLTWSNPVTVAKGQGAVDPGSNGLLVFQDKDYLAADKGLSSPFRDRAYTTWSSFQEDFNGAIQSFRVPIMSSHSDNGDQWSAPLEISGFSPACSATISGRPNECDLNQDSYPATAPNGRVYVSFENFNTPAENQFMIVSSADGGTTWTNPVRIDTAFDINFPSNVDGRATLTGCQLRYSVKGNTATDPSDPTGSTAYVVWADNRNGSAAATNVDVFLARSTDRGRRWSVFPVDTGANDQFYPWVDVAPDGRVDVGYMDRSYSAGQQVCKYGFTVAHLTFQNGKPTITRQRVDTGLSHADRSAFFSGTTNGNTRFIGDYNGLAVGANGVTYSLWTDERELLTTPPPSPTRNHGQHAAGARTP